MSSKKPARDILRDLWTGRLNLGAAEAIFEAELTKDWPSGGVDLHEAMGFSVREYTAYLHGATLDDVAQLRYNGWPQACSVCGLPIDYEAFWWIGSRAGMQQIRHVTCPSNITVRTSRDSRAAWIRETWLATMSSAIGYPLANENLLDFDVTTSLRNGMDERLASERTRGAEVVVASRYRGEILRRLKRYGLLLGHTDAVVFHAQYSA